MDESASSGPGRLLRGVTWDHPRGVAALAACAAEFRRQTGIAVRWSARPLKEFEDTPIGQLAQEYDLLALDHPFIGDAVEEGVLAALDDFWSPSDLAERSRDSAGPSHASYRWNGRQWGAAVDAACMVSAFQRGPLDAGQVPEHWGEVEHFARRHGRDAVLLAANPTHLWGTVLSLCEAVAAAACDPARPRDHRRDGRPDWWGDDGVDRGILTAALQLAAQLLSHCAPESLNSDPITVLDRLADPADSAQYSPLVFGYITYCRPGASAAIVEFTDAPTIGRSTGPAGTLTGGVGLSVSSKSRLAREAAEFVRFATSADVQRGLYTAAGGQAGRRSVWADHTINEHVTDFYGNTVATMDRAFLRPRSPGYPTYQRAAAHTLHQSLIAGAAVSEMVSTLNRLWRKHVRI